jgi:Tfp pilus assembly protein PilO
MSVTRKWSLLAAVLAVAVLAAGWFLLVAPKRTEATDLRNKAVAQQQANDQLVSQLEMLKQQQVELPQQRAELAVMRKQIPDNPALPTLVRNLTEAGRKVGVSIQSMAPAAPVALVSTTELTPVAAPATESSSESSSSESGTDTATPVPVAAPPAPSLFQVPLSLEVTGSYFELEQFVHRLEGLKRSLLVSGFTLAPATSTVTAGGEGDTSSSQTTGELSLKLQARVFLAPPVAPVTTPTTPTAPAVTGQ